MELILNLVQNNFFSFIVLIYLFRMRNEIKYTGFMVIAQDYAFMNTYANGSKDVYVKHKQDKMRELKDQNDFVSSVKKLY